MPFTCDINSFRLLAASEHRRSAEWNNGLSSTDNFLFFLLDRKGMASIPYTPTHKHFI